MTPTARPTVAIVPITDFRTPETTVDLSTIQAVLAGTSTTYTELELASGDAGAILRALGRDESSAGSHVVLAASATALETDVDAVDAMTPRPKQSRLGIVRASQVTASVRALGWGDKALFGDTRVRSLADWPLQAYLSPDATPFDPTKTWTFVAGGDVMLDRGVYRQLVINKKGADFAFAGGTVSITGRYCCSAFGLTVPRTKRLDSTPDVTNLLSGADISMVNLEGPVPVDWKYHPAGMRFTFDPALLVGLTDAGIDLVTLANNHIGNAQNLGMRQTVQAVAAAGLGHVGAGSTLAAAVAPAWYTEGGVKVAVFGYDTIAYRYVATGSQPGSAELSSGTYHADFAAARAAGAQVIIVYPHWGTEYKTGPTSIQQRWAHKLIAAGADIIIGSHPHWAGAVEVYKGKPIFYSLGDFVFDQNWSEQTEEGLMLELTYNGATLVQSWMHPIIDLDQAQPNLLDAASGKVVMDQVYGASKKWLPW